MSANSNQSVESLTNWLVERIAAELKVSPDAISVDESFSNLGMSSLQTLLVTEDLSAHMRVDDLGASLFWDYPTIQKLANHLVAAGQGASGA
jgi:hypothetical protein